MTTESISNGSLINLLNEVLPILSKDNCEALKTFPQDYAQVLAGTLDAKVLNYTLSDIFFAAKKDNLQELSKLLNKYQHVIDPEVFGLNICTNEADFLCEEITCVAVQTIDNYGEITVNDSNGSKYRASYPLQATGFKSWEAFNTFFKRQDSKVIFAFNEHALKTVLVDYTISSEYFDIKKRLQLFADRSGEIAKKLAEKELLQKKQEVTNLLSELVKNVVEKQKQNLLSVRQNASQKLVQFLKANVAKTKAISEIENKKIKVHPESTEKIVVNGVAYEVHHDEGEDEDDNLDLDIKYIDNSANSYLDKTVCDDMDDDIFDILKADLQQRMTDVETNVLNSMKNILDEHKNNILEFVKSEMSKIAPINDSKIWVVQNNGHECSNLVLTKNKGIYRLCGMVNPMSLYRQSTLIAFDKDFADEFSKLSYGSVPVGSVVPNSYYMPSVLNISITSTGFKFYNSKSALCNLEGTPFSLDITFSL